MFSKARFIEDMNLIIFNLIDGSKKKLTQKRIQCATRMDEKVFRSFCFDTLIKRYQLISYHLLKHVAIVKRF